MQIQCSPLSEMSTPQREPSAYKARRTCRCCRAFTSTDRGALLAHERCCHSDASVAVSKEVSQRRRRLRRGSFSVPTSPELLTSQYRLLMERHKFRNLLHDAQWSELAVADEEATRTSRVRMRYMIDCVDSKLSDVEKLIAKTVPETARLREGISRLDVEMKKVRDVE